MAITLKAWQHPADFPTEFGIVQAAAEIKDEEFPVELTVISREGNETGQSGTFTTRDEVEALFRALDEHNAACRSWEMALKCVVFRDVENVRTFCQAIPYPEEPDEDWEEDDWDD
ncbi:hypothetical protein HY375_02365 [Candidatus Berkelbacteria bacterium]|nr:hypothetical protein [Candidatus Berkelbacteria bacterium]